MVRSKNWLWFLDNPVHAGHTATGKFRVYGEGSIWHPDDRPCDCWGKPNKNNPLRHPHIVRTDYNSRWHYYRVEIRNWLFERQMRRVPWAEMRETETATGQKPELHVPPLRPWVKRLFGDDPFPRDVPSVYAPILNKDSIYDRSNE